MSKVVTIAHAALVCLTVLAVSSCTQTSNGTADVPTTTGTAASGPSSANGGGTTMPAIPRPLDASRFMADPCLSLTQEQATQLSISPQGRPLTPQGTSGCAWPYGTSSEVGLTYVVPDAKNGLQNLYNQNSAGWYKNGYFEPTTIGGYPAVFQAGNDDRKNGQCQLSVGINEQTLLTVSNRGQKNTDVCSGAAKVAADVVNTIARG